ncbi:MAG: ArsR family transcriptional regulator, partial [Verrucomicrobiota bacterium]
ARPAGRWVFYSATPNLVVEHAGTIVSAVRECCAAGAENESLIEMATAFTHSRRISIVGCLSAGEKSYQELLASTHVSPAALYRHLEKLAARHMVEQENDLYRLANPVNPLAQALLAIATA